MKTLSLDRAKCNGCGICQAVCSIKKTGAVKPDEARIRIRREGGIDAQFAAVCQHCEEPVCVYACMRGIIDKDYVTGKITRRTEGCFACAACRVMCPHGAVVYDSKMGAFVTCAYCDGDPVCVKACPTGALKFQDLSMHSTDRRNAYAAGFFHSGGNGGRK